MEKLDILFGRDIGKILRIQINIHELENMNFGLVIPNVEVREKTDVAFTHTISELYIKRYSEEYATKVKEAYKLHQRNKKEKCREHPLADFFEVLDEIAPTFCNPREDILKGELPYLLGDNKYGVLRKDSYGLLEKIVTEMLQLPPLMRAEYQISQVIRYLQTDFWNGRLFREKEYQRQLIRLYCDIIVPQDLRH